MKKSAPTKSKASLPAVKLPSPVVPIENNALTVTTDSKVDMWFAAVEVIVKKADEINTQYQDLLYQRLNEMYTVYYHWKTTTEGKEDFFEQVEGLLDKRGIGYNAGTDEALKLTKTYTGKTASTASKHATHMRVAFNRGIHPRAYAAWTVENGVEAISRQVRRKPEIAAPRMSPEEKYLYSRACLLIQQWLMEKEQQPVASAVADVADFPPGANAGQAYEISICKTRADPKNQGKFIVDTLWILPRTAENEMLFTKILAQRLSKEEDAMVAMEEKLAGGNRADIKAEMERELYQVEQDVLDIARYEREFTDKLNAARRTERPGDVDAVLAKYDPRSSRKKKPKKKTP